METSVAGCLRCIFGRLLKPSSVSIRTSLHLSTKKIFRVQQNVLCRRMSVSATRRYAVWPDPNQGQGHIGPKVAKISFVHAIGLTNTL